MGQKSWDEIASERADLIKRLADAHSWGEVTIHDAALEADLVRVSESLN